jgi:hypothetical protein
MTQRRAGVFVPVGLFGLMAGNFVQGYAHGRYSDFAGGFLMSVSLVLLIAGAMQRASATNSQVQRRRFGNRNSIVARQLS